MACIDTTPLVAGETRLSPASVERAKTLLQENDPRKLRSGETKTVRMNEDELDLVIDHIVNRIGPGGATLKVKQNLIMLAATVELVRFAPGRYVNIDAEIRESDGRARVEHLTIGRVTVPGRIVDAVLGFAAEHLYRASGVHDAGDIIRAVDIQPGYLDVTYEWKAGIVDAVRDRLVSRDARERLRTYNDILVAETETQGSDLTCASLISAIFRVAAERSMDADPVSENRAAVLVLAAYMNGTDLTDLAPEARNWATPERRRLRIQGRRDFVRHFATSAALAVTGGDAVSNVVGLSKEIDDADGGSGFSFMDLTADMAGTRFGKNAVQDRASAYQLQQRIAAGIDDLALIPDVTGLEEKLTEAEFNQRYGGVGGERYQAAVADIESRIARSPLYRE